MCTAKERLELLEQPYLTGAEFARVLNRSPSVVNREIRKSKDRIYFVDGWGYLTDDLIKVFHLKPFVARLKKELQDTKKEADA